MVLRFYVWVVAGVVSRGGECKGWRRRMRDDFGGKWVRVCLV